MARLRVCGVRVATVLLDCAEQEGCRWVEKGRSGAFSASGGTGNEGNNRLPINMEKQIGGVRMRRHRSQACG